MGPTVRRFLSNYFDLLFYLIAACASFCHLLSSREELPLLSHRATDGWIHGRPQKFLQVGGSLRPSFLLHYFSRLSIIPLPFIVPCLLCPFFSAAKRINPARKSGWGAVASPSGIRDRAPSQSQFRCVLSCDVNKNFLPGIRTRTRGGCQGPGPGQGLHSQGPGQGPGFEYKDQDQNKDLSKCGHISVNIPGI